MVQKRKIPRRCIYYPKHFFKPAGIPAMDLEVIELSKEEITALYYADYRELKQVDAAKKMGISQASFSRELASARKKLAEALFENKGILFQPEPSDNE